jgi:uncharacterized damage-inducible protein DinB
MQTMSELFRTMARYNRWANARLYAAAAELDDASYRADRGAFFGSLHGTLNHLLVTDGIWLSRFRQVPRAMPLNAILHEDLAGLAAARIAADEDIVAFTQPLDEPALAAEIVYANSSGREFRHALGWALPHFFNHQTHHRGQAHAILTGLGRKAPELDLIYFQRISA